MCGLEIAITVQIAYIFLSQVQAGTSTLEVPSLITLERAQAWAYSLPDC